MNKDRKLRKRGILSELKEMVNDPMLTMESFIMPENFEGDSFEEEDFEEEPMEQPQQMDSSDIVGIEKELTQIRKIALGVINRLADQPQSPQYDTMKKIWNMVDKAIEQPSKGNQNI